jgi:hypothetical protein
MACRGVRGQLDDGTPFVAITCSRERPRACSSCGAHVRVGVLCDAPVTRKGKAGTCDRFCCRKCAVNVGPNRDYCAPHARVRADQP